MIDEQRRLYLLVIEGPGARACITGYHRWLGCPGGCDLPCILPHSASRVDTPERRARLADLEQPEETPAPPDLAAEATALLEESFQTLTARQRDAIDYFWASHPDHYRADGPLQGESRHG